ncbi:hypothetical protein AB4114_06315 [Paenibacillus sp. 2RAB27]
MRILVVSAHPNIEQSRVNKRWMAELRGLIGYTISELIRPL